MRAAAAGGVRDVDLPSDCVVRHLGEPGVFGLIAKWNDERALEAHLRSESFGVLQGALEVLARPAQFEVLLPAVNPLLRRVAI